MFSKTALLALAPIAMALSAGAVLPFQAASNAAAGRALGSPLWGALASLTVSSIAIVATALWTRTAVPTLTNAVQGPWWLWVGGLLGAVYVGSAAAVTPKLGAGGFLVCVVAGQMLAAMLADHFGSMGLAQKPLDLTRLAGVLLILAGVFVVQFSATHPSSESSAAKSQGNTKQ